MAHAASPQDVCGTGSGTENWVKFGANQYSAKDGFKFNWYDGYVNASFDRDSWTLVKDGNDYNHPSEDVLDGESFKDYGSVVIGEKGKLFFNRGRNKWIVKPSGILDGFDEPDQAIHRAGGDNYGEWMDAITGKVEQGQSWFGQSGPLTETVLLGVIAQRVPDTRLEWDAEKMQIKGRDDLQPLIQRKYRNGWEIKV